jgi:hypothetical protein
VDKLLVFPTRRRAFQRNPDGTTDKRLTAITIDFDDVEVG